MKARKLGTCRACNQVADGGRVCQSVVELGRRGEGTLVRRVYHAECWWKMTAQEQHDRINGGRTCSDYCKRSNALHLVHAPKMATATREEAAR